MAYTLVIKKQAKNFLERLSKTDRQRITEKIVLLGNNPNSPTLDIKPLEGEPHYRMRVGRWRVVFDRDDKIKIILIEKIRARGDVYK